MKTIVVASQKGGVGKTSLSRNLAATAASEKLRVLMIDLDPQGTTKRWLERRKTDDLTMLEADPAPEDVPALLEQLAAGDHFDLVVIDTPPLVANWMPPLMRASDLVLVPSKASTDDLDALGPTIAAARTAGQGVVFAMTMVNPRASLTDAAARALAQHGRVAPTNICNRVVFAEMGGAGESVIEARDPKALEEIADLWSFVKGDLT